jgi:hypothetical protein
MGQLERRAALVDVAALPEYPFDADQRLDGHFFTMVPHDRWLNSDLRMLAGLEVRGAALELVLIAQKQTPIGTLPDNDLLLSRLLLLPLDQWQSLRARDPGPLDGWQPCRVGGALRLMSGLVNDIVGDAIKARDDRARLNKDKSEYQRQKRLRDAMRQQGCLAAMVADDALVAQIDGWMAANCESRRTAAEYEAALTHASHAGWLQKHLRR